LPRFLHEQLEVGVATIGEAYVNPPPPNRHTFTTTTAADYVAQQHATMPAQRPRAQFEPIPPSLNIGKLVENYENLNFVTRIPWDAVKEQGFDAFERLVRQFVVQGGQPLVIEGLNTLLDPWTFGPKWLQDNVGDKVENARDIVNKDNVPLTIGHYLKSINGVTNQHFRRPTDANQKAPQRIYLKDIDCPKVWHDKLQEVLPPFLFYLNESTGDVGGPGSGVDPNSHIPGRRLGRGIARAGDLMSSPPPEMRAENLMCYIGHEGTYTPAHREMCGSLGQNIMVEASGDSLNDEGKTERAGSSLWFMTETKDRHQVAEYWLSTLGHDIETENHFAQINSWKLAPFNVYIVDQRPGDLILIPPMAPHQVWNRGTRTMKVAWNRSTLETLEIAMEEALPKARIVCRDEQYKNKAMIYYTLCKYSDLLSDAKRQADKLSPEAGHAMMYKGKIRQLQKDFKSLFTLFGNIMLSEMWAADTTQEKCEYLPFESNVTCAYCRGNIFNRFLSCQNCADALGHSDDEPYDVCMECYAMGRSCWCISGHKWVEQFKWKELSTKFEGWRKQILELQGDVNPPLPLHEMRRRYPKKTLAEICRAELKKRPFKDAKKPKEDDEAEKSEEEIIVDDDGRVKKTVKKHSKTFLKNNSTCHVCKHRHPNWKMAHCNRCERWWCYGGLYRGHDDMPQTIMEDPDWECPHCKGICFVGACRIDPRQRPYEPHGTLLGHDTKKVADARSVEALVDFSVSNLNWIREDQEAEETVQMRKAREAADKAREAEATQVVDDDDEGSLADAPDDATNSPQVIDVEDSMLDPALREETDIARSLSQYNALPSPAAMIQGARPPTNGYDDDDYDGYAPATTSGYVAPTALMHRNVEIEDTQYPDPSEIYGNGYGDMEDTPPDSNSEFRPFGPPSKQGKKRKRHTEGEEQITMEKPKKRRVTEDPAILAQKPQTEASRQYQSIKERKALNEAKRTGRFIAVSAALRGRKKLVKIKVPVARLAQIMARAAAKRNNAPTVVKRKQTDGADGAELLRSNIPTAQSKPSRPAANPNKAVVRVERDDDFSTRKARGEKSKLRQSQPQVEEIDIASDLEDDSYLDDAMDFLTKDTSAPKEPRGKRTSAYCAARQEEDDSDLPEELPDNFREPARRRHTEGGEPREPRELPDRRSTGQFKAVNGTAPKVYTGRPRGRPRKNQLQPAQDSEEALAEEMERNRLAKLAAIEISDDDAHDEDDDEEIEMPPPAFVPVAAVSKKRKIVSADQLKAMKQKKQRA